MDNADYLALATTGLATIALGIFIVPHVALWLLWLGVTTLIN